MTNTSNMNTKQKKKYLFKYIKTYRERSAYIGLTNKECRTIIKEILKTIKDEISPTLEILRALEPFKGRKDFDKSHISVMGVTLDIYLDRYRLKRSNK